MSELFAEPKPTFLIVDGHALIYRAYHAFPALTDSEGHVAGAFFGFLRILLSVLDQVQPECWLVAFDDPAPTKRRQKYDFYKANRPPMPEDLRPQVTLIREAVDKLGAPIRQIPGVEADDIIGTVSRQVSSDGKASVLILTGDKDSFQLVDENVHVLVPNSTRSRSNSHTESSMIEYNPARVEQKMGVPPEKIVDLKALAGDASDNIPGVRGIGPKTAVALIQKFGSVDGIYKAIDQENVDDVRASVVAKLIGERENAYISRELAQIDRFVENIDFDYDACRIVGYDKQVVSDFLLHYGFKSLLKYLPRDEFDEGLQAALF